MTLRADVADDLLQDLAVKLAGSNLLAGATNPYAIARTAATNLAIDWHRRQHRTAGPLPDLSSSDDRPPLARMVEREEVERLVVEMAALDDRDRALLTMRFFDARGYDEIGREVGQSPHNARALVHRAVARLRHRMELPAAREAAP